jgi:hypothetical protein
LLDRRGADAAKLADLAFEVAGGQVPCASAPDMFFAEKFGFDIACLLYTSPSPRDES